MNSARHQVKWLKSATDTQTKWSITKILIQTGPRTKHVLCSWTQMVKIRSLKVMPTPLKSAMIPSPKMLSIFYFIQSSFSAHTKNWKARYIKTSSYRYNMIPQFWYLYYILLHGEFLLWRAVRALKATVFNWHITFTAHTPYLINFLTIKN